ncbi:MULTISPECIES: DUF2141 domain-containing protein [unclassified Colwellia]|jgi:uncharacterized protein (DUF2141 family)|uniref:DUF2141 domain-containing protein n=1 Tax=unclassified Colwellia TaxID=196834 RepID=UPI0015F5E0A8|nr:MULTISPECIES: DUF2141 domain-containing protein [unclassified Colwellia]MBA6365557.1 DUF2141 domain-containing protein [Colwellia sp. BRX8-8]MBA6336965.1 DUF2141 domain-containing protein [Colwellia sp. BRX8-7]MBA6348163.1 DUF2141 domain-containing protein [Colwellia sp. BRX8-9]MBA6351345.1 DUF2141 domain-containing protein [Colwellia sp. BRX9-1]MBA6354579.1 DUF2141 domain-containing protein [Colwellia sp. BRX8-3]
MIFKKLISLSVTSLALSVISALSMILLLSQHAVAADLTVNISDIEQGKGHLLIALYASEEDYKTDKASFYAKVKAQNGKEIAIFENVPDGDYAIKMYQDENDNNKMDFNMMGIPKEGYGFSNNVGMFGAPKYKEAKFMVKENTAITIDLF